MRTFIFTNIEKNILLSLGYMATLYQLLTDHGVTDRIRIWKPGDNVNSKSDYTIGL